MGVDAERERVLALVAKHGWNATAFQTLERGYHYFFYGSDACVAYVDTGRAWVVAGAPIAAHGALEDTVSAFVTEAARHGKRTCFFATEERLQRAANTAIRSMKIGEQPVWDPSLWPQTVSQHRSLREQLRRAKAKGVRVRRLEPEELAAGPTREAIESLSARWLRSRNMAPLEFLVRVEPFAFPKHRSCFVAERDGALVGFAAAVPVPARGGWFVEDLLRDDRAPNGTVELLVDAAMRWAESAGSTWLTFGLAPLAGDVSPALRWMRRNTRTLYDFEGLHAFKRKLRPQSWSPIYLSFPRTQWPLTALLDGLTAFTPHGLVRFALQTLRHRFAPRPALPQRCGGDASSTVAPASSESTSSAKRET